MASAGFPAAGRVSAYRRIGVWQEPKPCSRPRRRPRPRTVSPSTSRVPSIGAPGYFGTKVLTHPEFEDEDDDEDENEGVGFLPHADTPTRFYRVPGYSFTKSRLLDSSNAVNTGLAPGSEAGCMGHDPLVAKVRSHSA